MSHTPADGPTAGLGPAGYTDSAEGPIFTVAGGVAEVQPELITVLADAAENVAEIDVTRAEEARWRAEQALHHVKPGDSDAYSTLEAALRRSNLRIDSVRRYRPGRRPPESESHIK